MKLFFKNTIQFFIILYGSVFTLAVISNYVINTRADFKLKPTTNKIILGNSHPAGAFNDSLISNFKNLASPGEGYFYGYQKLRKILEQNPQVDTVYLEFNPKTILIWEDTKIWKKHQVPNNLAFFDFSDHRFLAINNTLGYQQAVLKGIKINLKRIVLNQYNFIDSIGGYRYVESSKIDSILNTLSYEPRVQYGLEHKKLSRYDSSYLKKMVSLCKNKNIKIIFVRSPYHKKFDGHNYEDLFQNYRRENFGTIEFMDFKDFPTDDTEFKDLEHLNCKGAKKFSEWFENQKGFIGNF